MNTKKIMLRKAAAFVSALTFLSVSNMTSVSVMAAAGAHGSSSAAASVKVNKTAPVPPDMPEIVTTTTTAPAVTTTTTTTVTTTSAQTTTATDQVTTTTAAEAPVMTDLYISFADDVYNDKSDIADALDRKVKEKNPGYKARLADESNSIIITYDTADDIFNNCLNVFEYNVLTEENRRLKKYVYDGIIRKKVYYRADGDTELLRDSEAVTELTVNGAGDTTYIAKDTVLGNDSFSLDKFHFADGNYTVSHAFVIDNDGVHEEDRNGVHDTPVLPFKEKTFSLNFQTRDARCEIITADGSPTDKNEFMYSEIENFKIRVKSKKNCDCFQLKNEFFNKQFSFDEFDENSEKTIPTIKTLPLKDFVSEPEKKETLENSETFVYEVFAKHSMVDSIIKYHDASGSDLKEENGKVMLLNSDYCIDPLIYRNNKTYYLKKYEYRYSNTPGEENLSYSFSSYDDLVAHMDGPGAVAVHSESSSNDPDNPNNHGLIFPVSDPYYFILEYGEIDNQDSIVNPDDIFKKICASLGDHKTLKDTILSENAIVAKWKGNISPQLGANYNGCTLYFLDKNNVITKATVQNGSIRFTVPSVSNPDNNNLYYRLYAINRKVGDVNYSIPVQPFTLYFDTKSPVLPDIENDGEWTNKKTLRLNINESFDSDHLDLCTSNKQKLDNISAVTVNDLVFQKPNDADWVIGQPYDASNGLRYYVDDSSDNTANGSFITDNEYVSTVSGFEDQLNDLKEAYRKKLNTQINNWNAVKNEAKTAIKTLEKSDDEDNEDLINDYNADIKKAENNISELNSQLSKLDMKDPVINDEYTDLKKQYEKYKNGSHFAGKAVDHSISCTDPYQVVLTPRSDEDGSVYFELTLTVNDVNGKAFNDSLSVSVFDHSGNKSNTQTVNDVKVEQTPPRATRIKLNDYYGNEYKNNVCNSILNVASSFDDKYDDNECSGLGSKEIWFTDDPENISDDTPKADSNGMIDLSHSNIKKGYVVIRVTDNAGNDALYYYCSSAANKATDTPDSATPIMVDKDAPSTPVPTLPENSNGWLADYPALTVTAADNNKNYASGIEQLIITIEHGSNEQTISGINLSELADPATAKALAEGKFRLVFAQNETNKDIADVYLEVNGKKLSGTPLPESVKLRSSDDENINGSIKVSVEAVDSAHNHSSAGECVFFVDNTDPEAVGTFVFNNSDRSDVKTNITPFGAFANNNVCIRVPVMDNGYSSNLKKAVLYLNADSDTPKIETAVFRKDNDVLYAEFENIPEEIITDAFSGIYVPEFVVYDNVDNCSERRRLSAAYSIDDIRGIDGADSLVIENKPPVIRCSITGPDEYIKNNNEHWYSGDAELVFSCDDDGSGISRFNVNGTSTANAYSYHTEPVHNDVYTVRTGLHDGKYEYMAEAEDNAFNRSDKVITNNQGQDVENDSIAVFKDTTKPVIDSVVFSNNVRSLWGNSLGHFFRENYGLFANTSSQMTITANDEGASAGIKCICVQLIDSGGSYVLRDNDKNYITIYNDSDQKDLSTFVTTVDIPDNFKGDIRVWTVDNVGNGPDGDSSEISDYKWSPFGFISETASNHADTSEVKITLPETANKDAAGHPLYNKSIDAQIRISEPQSGINNVEITHSSGVRITTDFDSADTAETAGWSIGASDRNIITDASRTINISGEGNDNVLSAGVEDNAGNILEKENNSVVFSIDTIAPEIKLDGIDEAAADSVRYFNTDKKARVTIKDRNYDKTVINGKDTVFESDRSVTGNDAGQVYVWEENYTTDGRYSLDIDCTDLAGNKAAGKHTGTFVIDKTAPVASITTRKLGGESVETGRGVFIDSDVEVIVSVQEANFDPASFNVTINGDPYSSGTWSSGNTHNLLIPSSFFEDGGKYSISISGKDSAGNSLKSVSTEFAVDKAKPVISIDGVKSANNGDVAPVVKIVEDNVEIQDLTIRRNNEQLAQSIDENNNTVSYKITDGAFITGKVVDGNSGVSKVVFDNFPMTESFDGNYEINVSVTDKAYNKTFASQEFSVNRFGSVFSIEDADSINGCHLNKAPEIRITERNVDKHIRNNEVAIIIDKGTDTIQLSKDQYTISEPVSLPDGSGYEYLYTIGSGVFDQDLEYSITIQTIDAAGNRNVSKLRGADVSFSVDTHEPEFTCNGLIDRAEFRESNREFRINPTEQLMHIKVTTSLGEVLLDSPGKLNGDNSYVFTLPAANRARDLIVELIDLAGNTTVKTFTDLLVTENIMLYTMHKTWAKATAAAVAALGLGTVGGAALIKRRRKRFY